MKALTRWGARWFDQPLVTDYGQFHHPEAVEAFATIAWTWDYRVSLTWLPRPDWRHDYGALIEPRAIYGATVHFLNRDTGDLLVAVEGSPTGLMHQVPLDRVLEITLYREQDYEDAQRHQQYADEQVEPA